MDNTPDTAGLTDQISTLSEELARYRRELQESERSLVTRIADVDDDRRLTTSRLQRAWQTHHEEIDARLRRQASVFAGSLLLLTILLGIGLFFAFGQLDAARRALLGDVTALRAEYAQLAALAARDEALEESLSSLRAALAAMSDALPSPAVPAPDGAGSAPETPAPSAGPESTVRQPIAETDATDEEAPQAKPPPAAEAEPPSPDPASDPATGPETESAAKEHATETASDAAEPSPPQPPDHPTPALAESEPAPRETPPEAPTENPEPLPAELSPEILETDAQAVDAAGTRTGGARVRVADEPHVVATEPFALQLIGFYTLDALIEFARREALPSRVYFREESYQGRPWFVLIHSLHARYSDASDSIERLPTELAILDTWIRNFSPETRLGILEIER